MSTVVIENRWKPSLLGHQRTFDLFSIKVFNYECIHTVMVILFNFSFEFRFPFPRRSGE